jgi:hypothetical protein
MNFLKEFYSFSVFSHQPVSTARHTQTPAGRVSILLYLPAGFIAVQVLPLVLHGTFLFRPPFLTACSKFVLRIDRSVKFDSSVKFEFKIGIFAPYLISVAGFPKGGIRCTPLPLEGHQRAK